MSHTCHATGCDIAVPPSMFMCKAHWFSLPKPMRDAIWATYREGQENTKDPSADYLHNARTAIEWIAAREAAQPRIENGAEISAITVWQPWAQLIAAGAKPYEFRSWPAPRALQGRRIAIHAGARKPPRTEVQGLLLRLHGNVWRETGLHREKAIEVLEKTAFTAFHLSALLCTARLGTPIRNAEMERALGLPARNDSDRDEHSNWGWPLTDIRQLRPPVPARGSQGFFKVTVPAEIAS